MSSASIACPNCQVRLKLNLPYLAEEDRTFSCPRCGQVIVVAGAAQPTAVRSSVLLWVLCATILVTGGGIIAALLLTRTPAEKLENQYVVTQQENTPEQNTPKSREKEKNREEPQTQRSQEQIQIDLKKLREQGDEALAAKQYAAAAEIYKLVLQKTPGDGGASKGLVAAQEGLAKDDVERKKQDDFQRHMAAGQAALQAGRFADAVGEFAAAQLILPRNLQAAGLQREAERRLAAERNRQDQKTDFERLMDMAATAFRGQRYDEAVQSYQKALEIVPGDPAALKGLDSARQALGNVTMQFELLMAQGGAAMREARFKDAVDAFAVAARLFPANDSAATALRVAVAAFENQASYVAAMRRANLALRNLLFDDAVLAFTEALRLVPNDVLAAAGLADAQRRIAELVRLRAESDALVKAGADAARQRKYAEAARAYKDALKVFPAHPQADRIRGLWRYNDSMADGTADLAARRYQEAVRHFQAALAEVPNDAAALAGLNRARALANTKAPSKDGGEKKGPAGKT
jgi:tetratricopeptide (TPR) repeat protein